MKLYTFGLDVTSGEAPTKELLGGKGFGLVEMSMAGLPVPPGFTIPTTECLAYLNAGKNGHPLYQFTGLLELVTENMTKLADKFGYMPLVSVRSGARVSMPGMMDTILNVGLTSETLPEWEKRIGKKAAWDSYRRLIQMYSSVVLEIEHERFENILQFEKTKAGVETDADLGVTALKRITTEYQKLVEQVDGEPFPDSLEAQLCGAIKAVFKSWNNDRAKAYREMNNIPDDWGTAVNIQAMVFGNKNEKSCSGVLFTRNPSTGEDMITGEFLPNAQGEDVVAGIRTPLDITALPEWNEQVVEGIVDAVDILEKKYKDMQDVEFTVQDGELFLLQTRNGKRSARAAFKIAYDFFEAGIIDVSELKSRVTAKEYLALSQPSIDPSFKTPADMTGIPAGGNVVTGEAVFSSEEAVKRKALGKKVILVARETTPDDILGMGASVGILTSTGGLTSHAAVVARGMNKTCVVGVTDMHVTNSSIKSLASWVGPDDNYHFAEGDKITIDGLTGRVWAGTDVPVIQGDALPEADAAVAVLLKETEHLIKGTKVEDVVNGQLYVPSYAFEGVCEFETAKFKELLEALVENGAKVIVDLSAKCDINDEHDNMMEYLTYKPVNALNTKVSAILEVAEHNTDVLSVALPDTTPDSTKQLLVDAGVGVIGTVTTVNDILISKEYIQITDKVIKDVFGGKKAFNEFIALMKKAGKTVKYMPTPVEKAQAVLETLQ